jgi:hypothetical protein
MPLKIECSCDAVYIYNRLNINKQIQPVTIIEPPVFALRIVMSFSSSLAIEVTSIAVSDDLGFYCNT